MILPFLPIEASKHLPPTFIYKHKHLMPKVWRDIYGAKLSYHGLTIELKQLNIRVQIDST